MLHLDEKMLERRDCNPTFRLGRLEGNPKLCSRFPLPHAAGPSVVQAGSFVNAGLHPASCGAHGCGRGLLLLHAHKSRNFDFFAKAGDSTRIPDLADSSSVHVHAHLRKPVTRLQDAISSEICPWTFSEQGPTLAQLFDEVARQE